MVFYDSQQDSPVYNPSKTCLRAQRTVARQSVVLRSHSPTPTHLAVGKSSQEDFPELATIGIQWVLTLLLGRVPSLGLQTCIGPSANGPRPPAMQSSCEVPMHKWVYYVHPQLGCFFDPPPTCKIVSLQQSDNLVHSYTSAENNIALRMGSTANQRCPTSVGSSMRPGNLAKPKHILSTSLLGFSPFPFPFYSRPPHIDILALPTHPLR